MAIQNILIIGGGITGLTAATALCHRGFSVDVIERRPALGDLGGVGLSIMGNATKALATLGIAEACVRAGMPADEMTIRSPDGKVLGPSVWPSLGKPDWPAQIGISRATFHRILADAAHAAGARIRCSLTVVAIAQHATDASVRFSDGSEGAYSLVIAADGIYSQTRGIHFPAAPRPAPTGLSLWRAPAKCPDGITTTQFHIGGPQGLVGICPITPTDCYLYCLDRTPNEPMQEVSTLHLQMREKLKDYGGLIPGVAAQLNDPAQINFRPLEWLLVPDPWYRGRILLMGDAAHANPPNMSQGAAMGIEDAVVLADELTRDGSLDQVLQRFMARRFPRARLVVEVSCEIARAEIEHRPGPEVQALIRDASAELNRPW